MNSGNFMGLIFSFVITHQVITNERIMNEFLQGSSHESIEVRRSTVFYFTTEDRRAPFRLQILMSRQSPEHDNPLKWHDFICLFPDMLPDEGPSSASKASQIAATTHVLQNCPELFTRKTKSVKRN